MSTIANYAFQAKDSFAERPLSRVDSLCLSWLAYLHFPDELDTSSSVGVPIRDLSGATLRSKLVASVHDAASSSLLLQSMAASPRFADVRVCLHEAHSDDLPATQFAATTFLLPDGQGAYVAFRGTDNTLVGWKENMHLICPEPVGAQLRAAAYLERVAATLDCPLWVGGHSKGGNLAAYACATASEELAARVSCCFSHDGPGFDPALRAREDWRDLVPLEKTIPTASLVGMLFERSQEPFTVVRSSAEGVMQHAPFSWELAGNDFRCAQGMDYDAWKLVQRVNDWLEDMSYDEREAFADLLAWLLDVTCEPSFSGLLSRWSKNAQLAQTALAAAPAEDRELFGRVMDDLVTTVVLGSRQEYAPAETSAERADAAARRMDDLLAHANDRFSRLDRLTGE